MTILTRQERERLVLELCNQGKTYHEISKVARISPCDIGVILNKIIEVKQKEYNNKIMLIRRRTKNNYLFHSSLQFFSDTKTPLEVAIALNLKESEATKF
jgi:hypothetical protein